MVVPLEQGAIINSIIFTAKTCLRCTYLNNQSHESLYHRYISSIHYKNHVLCMSFYRHTRKLLINEGIFIIKSLNQFILNQTHVKLPDNSTSSPPIAHALALVVCTTTPIKVKKICILNCSLIFSFIQKMSFLRLACSHDAAIETIFFFKWLIDFGIY